MISREISQEDQQEDNMVHSGIISPCIGRIAASGDGAEVLVEFNGVGPMNAKLLAGLNRCELTRPESAGRQVLIVFEQGDPDRPIIIGLMDDPLERIVTMEVSPPKEALIDGKRVTIEAQEEIVLKCGSGSITIRKDGKIIIKGTHLLSRSSGPIRIKGASVNIN